MNLYLELEQLRFDDKISVDMKVEYDLMKNSTMIRIPSLLIQPILENAFKHGLSSKEEKGILKVRFSSNEKFLNCSIEDNGMGRSLNAKLESVANYTSSGISTTLERLSALDSNFVGLEESSVKIIDLKNKNGEPCGTKVKLKIRYC